MKIALLLSVVALSSIGYYVSRLPSAKDPSLNESIEADTPDQIAQRQSMGDFILTDAAGKQKKLSEFRGNVLILSFWATWCTPCLDELQTFAEIDKKLHDRGLRIVAINVDEDEAGQKMANDFISKNQFSFAHFNDPNKELVRKFEVEILPSNFVLDRNGRLAFSSFGANDWSSPTMLETIESLLIESP